MPLVASGSQQCPLLAQSGHHDRAERCPLSEVKRTLGFSDRIRGHQLHRGDLKATRPLIRHSYCNAIVIPDRLRDASRPTCTPCTSSTTPFSFFNVATLAPPTIATLAEAAP